VALLGCSVTNSTRTGHYGVDVWRQFRAHPAMEGVPSRVIGGTSDGLRAGAIA
jgi:hypothetical protein